MDTNHLIEPIYKMNRLGPADSLMQPLPVKFRQVMYDPALVEQEATRLDQESDQDSESTDTEISFPVEPKEKVFFKNPLRLPDFFKTEKKTLSTVKLAKNMRTNNGFMVDDDRKKIFQLMTEGNRLLNLQKEQKELHKRQVASQQMAAVLVNDLLSNGFHITPPETTPRPEDNSWSYPTSKVSAGNEDSLKNIVGGNQLIVSMHRELKRLQICDEDSS